MISMVRYSPPPFLCSTAWWQWIRSSSSLTRSLFCWYSSSYFVHMSLIIYTAATTYCLRIGFLVIWTRIVILVCIVIVIQRSFCPLLYCHLSHMHRYRRRTSPSFLTLQWFRCSKHQPQWFRCSKHQLQIVSLFKASTAMVSLLKASIAMVSLFKASTAMVSLFKASTAMVSLFKASTASPSLSRLNRLTKVHINWISTLFISLKFYKPHLNRITCTWTVTHKNPSQFNHCRTHKSYPSVS